MLLATRRFLPLFITQFLGAFNDNLFKNAVVMLLAFKLADQVAVNPNILIIAAGGLFIVPYFLFSATAGQLADKYDKAMLARLTKLWEIIIVGIGMIGFIGHHPNFLLLVLFCLGAQSTFFGPVKYALLPQHLRDDELLSGNAMVEAGTFLAILLGTIVGGLLVMADGGEMMIAIISLVVALMGYVASRFIPPAPAPMPGLRIRANIFSATWDIIQHDRKTPRVFRSIIGISWLWVMGAVYLSQFPSIAKDVLGGDESVVTLFLALFSLGVGAGSMLVAMLTKGKISTRYVVWGAFGIVVFSLDLGLLCLHTMPPLHGGAIGIAQFLHNPMHWRVMIDLFMAALAGGVFVVPLYAIMQHDSEAASRARTIATNNVINAVFMVLSAVVSAALVQAGYGVGHILLLLAAIGLWVAIYCRRFRTPS